MNGYKKLLNAASQEFEQALGETSYLNLEEAIVDLFALFEEKKITYFDGITGPFTKAISTRFFNESFGFLACLRGGAFNASYHHIRDLLEIVAIFHYVYKHKNKKNRFECYNKYAKIWSNNQKNPNPKEINKWSGNLSIKDSLENLFKEREFPDESKIDFVELYYLLCNYTHFSPLVMEGDAKNLFFGIPKHSQQIKEAIRYVSTMIVLFFYTAERFNTFILDFKLISPILQKLICKS